ncbi:MAG: AhpC/TSA family protein, partial [Thermoprotei archaeon]
MSNSNLSEEEKLRHMLMKKLLRSMSRGGVMADVIEIKNENEFDEYLNKSRNKGKLVIADFWAPWCPP